MNDQQGVDWARNQHKSLKVLKMETWIDQFRNIVDEQAPNPLDAYPHITVSFNELFIEFFEAIDADELSEFKSTNCLANELKRLWTGLTYDEAAIPRYSERFSELLDTMVTDWRFNGIQDWSVQQTIFFLKQGAAAEVLV